MGMSRLGSGSVRYYESICTFLFDYYEASRARWMVHKWSPWWQRETNVIGQQRTVKCAHVGMASKVPPEKARNLLMDYYRMKRVPVGPLCVELTYTVDLVGLDFGV